MRVCVHVIVSYICVRMSEGESAGCESERMRKEEREVEKSDLCERVKSTEREKRMKKEG